MGDGLGMSSHSSLVLFGGLTTHSLRSLPAFWMLMMLARTRMVRFFCKSGSAVSWLGVVVVVVEMEEEAAAAAVEEGEDEEEVEDMEAEEAAAGEEEEEA